MKDQFSHDKGQKSSPTPETNAAIVMAYAGEEMVPIEVAERLELERNTARKEAEKARKSLDLLIKTIEKRFPEN